MTRIAKGVLVQASFWTDARSVERDEVGDAYPLGIAYLHGALEVVGHAIKLCIAGTYQFSINRITALVA